MIVGGDHLIENMFRTRGWAVTRDIEEASLIQFTGGADVSPHLYDEPQFELTQTNPVRDQQETKIFELAQMLGKPCAGICRGAQFLNVMCGGKLWQHVEGHTCGYHDAVTDDGRVLRVTSTHHQVIVPTTRGKVLLTAPSVEAKFYAIPDEHKQLISIEAVWYPNHRVVCYQPHPEYAGVTDCTDLYFEYLEKYL